MNKIFSHKNTKTKIELLLQELLHKINKKQVYDINLSSNNILSSDFFYLRNNDLIYIKPLKFKGFKKSQSQLLLSTLTTLAVLLNVYFRYSAD